MALKFDELGLKQALFNNLKDELNVALIAWKNEVISKMRFNEFKKNAELSYKIIEEESNIIVAYLSANTYVLADSYGTGSLMLADNPGYQAYRNSDRWNKARTTNVIVGRPEGKYTDILSGKEKYSSGYMEGYNLEKVEMRTGYKINPVSPSYALQMAYQWLYNTYLPKAYQNAVNKINFSSFIKSS